MDVENHIGGAVADLCIGMSPRIVKELVDSLLGVLSRCGLLSGAFGQCHEYCQIDGPCILQETTNNLFDAFLTSAIKERTVISWRRCLSILAIHGGIGVEGAMLLSVKCGVSITSELFHDIVWHGKVGVSLVVIPFQVDAAI
jgi:hypothetical protein